MTAREARRAMRDGTKVATTGIVDEGTDQRRRELVGSVTAEVRGYGDRLLFRVRAGAASTASPASEIHPV